MAIVREALRGQKSVAEIWREHQISQSFFYRLPESFACGRSEGFEQARATIEEWIREDYNRLSVHLALGYRSPEEKWQKSVLVFGGHYTAPSDKGDLTFVGYWV